MSLLMTGSTRKNLRLMTYTFVTYISIVSLFAWGPELIEQKEEII